MQRTQSVLFKFYSIAALAAFVLFAVACSTPEPAKKSGSASTPTKRDNPETSSIAPGLERDVLFYVNKHRESKGLPALSFHAVIAEEARKHSTDMASKRVPFGHDGLTVRTRIITGKIGTVNIVSENVARGTLTGQQVVNLWLKSAGHRKNIEGKYKFTGIGVARDRKSELYFTQIFAN